MNAQSKTGPVDFDLARGRVDAGAAPGDHRVVLVPVAALGELEKAVGAEAIQRLTRSIGASLGRRVASKLDGASGVKSASLEAFVSSLATEVAVSGWGVLRLERWGRALVLGLDDAPGLSGSALAALLEGAIEAAAGREVHGVVLNGKGAEGRARVLVVGGATAERARRWLSEGVAEHEVLTRLNDSRAQVSPPQGGAA